MRVIAHEQPFNSRFEISSFDLENINCIIFNERGVVDSPSYKLTPNLISFVYERSLERMAVLLRGEESQTLYFSYIPFFSINGDHDKYEKFVTKECFETFISSNKIFSFIVFLGRTELAIEVEFSNSEINYETFKKKMNEVVSYFQIVSKTNQIKDYFQIFEFVKRTPLFMEMNMYKKNELFFQNIPQNEFLMDHLLNDTQKSLLQVLFSKILLVQREVHGNWQLWYHTALRQLACECRERLLSRLREPSFGRFLQMVYQTTEVIPFEVDYIEMCEFDYTFSDYDGMTFDHINRISQD